MPVRTGDGDGTAQLKAEAGIHQVPHLSLRIAHQKGEIEPSRLIPMPLCLQP